MQDKIILVEKDIQETKEAHEKLVKHLQEAVAAIEKLTLEKEKTTQLLAIKAGEFQAYNKVLQILKTEEEIVVN
jgi:precorrin-6B methylase 1